MSDQRPSDDAAALLALLDGLRERGLEPSLATVGTAEVRFPPPRRQSAGSDPTPVGLPTPSDPARSYLGNAMRELRERRRLRDGGVGS